MSTDVVEVPTKPIIGPWHMMLPMVLALGLALGIMAIFGHQSVVELLQHGKSWPVQATLGVSVGLLLSGSIVILIKFVPYFDPFHRQMIDLLRQFDLAGFNPIWFSLAAGVGEEMLFRGALQPLLGIWLTSVVFTGVHFRTGAFHTMNWMKALYALLVFLLSLLLGGVYSQIGLFAAVVTHAVADIVFLTALRAAPR